MHHERLLSDLISIRSYSGEEEKLRSYIENWFTVNGIESFVQGDNLIVHLDGKKRDKAFIFNSHMDTVNEGDVPWKYGAFTPTFEDDRLVGLGASDMKSGLASSMLLAKHFAFSKNTPCDMWFTYVVREEVDGSGTQDFINWFQDEGYLNQYQDMAAIFTEPTGLAEIEHGHRGNLFLVAKVQGVSGHSSRPDKVPKDSSAIFKMNNFAQALIDTASKWNQKYPNDNFQPAITVGYTSVESNRRVINGRTQSASPNKLPDSALGTFDLRTTSEFHGIALDEVKNLAKKFGVQIELEYPAAPAGYTSSNEKIVKVTKSLIKNPKLTVTLGSADLGFFTSKGVKGIIFGPGEKDQQHVTNEYAKPAQIPLAVETYWNIVNSWSK